MLNASIWILIAAGAALPSATTALPKAKLLKSVVVPFEMERLDLI